MNLNEEINRNNKQPDIKKLVVVAFRCFPELRQRLEVKTKQAGFNSLSEYLANRLSMDDKPPINHDPQKIAAINDQLARLQKKVTIYETPTLLNYYKKLNGMSFDFQDSNGNQRNIKVTSPKDVFELMLASFKIEI